MIFPHCYFAFEDNKLPKIVPGKCNLEQGSCRVNVHFGLVMNCLFGALRMNWEGEVLAGLRKDGGDGDDGDGDDGDDGDDDDGDGGRGARWAEEGWWWETNGSNLGGGAVPTVQWEREMGVIRAVFKKV